MNFKDAVQPLRQWFRRIAISGLILLLLWGTFAGPTHAAEYNKEILRDHDFSGQDLTGDSFTKADLKGSNFSGSDLTGVSFFAANLEDTNFEGANLSFATLDSARFAKANLTNAIFEGAFAYTVEFRGATIDGADFTDAGLLSDAHDVLCQVAQGTNPVTGRQTRDTLACD
jgi:uncharacterized protein YjbI with pentapeptide repeats